MSVHTSKHVALRTTQKQNNVVPLNPKDALQGWVETPTSATCLVATAGAAAWVGALGWIMPGEDLPKVRFPVARAMVKCAKNTQKLHGGELTNHCFSRLVVNPKHDPNCPKPSSQMPNAPTHGHIQHHQGLQLPGTLL